MVAPTAPAGTAAALPRVPSRAPTDRVATPAEQAAADPPPPPGPNGWTPEPLVAVRSKNTENFLTSVVNFAIDPVEERPGQRLSTAMIDEIAPFMAATFRVDEQWVREELAKVYIYVGGPATSSGAAMTVGHHIFVPDETSLQRITAATTGGKRWLVHELAHTMQFLTYTGGNRYTFLASYLKGMAVGRDPQTTGTGDGPLVWGALFTGWRTTQDGHESIGAASATLRQRLGFSVLPAALIGGPLAVAAAGGIAATRATLRNRVLPDAIRSINVFGSGNAMTTGLALIAAPIMAGGVAGVFADKYGKRTSQVAGAGVGAGLAGAWLLRSGAFSKLGSSPLALGMTAGNLLAIAGIAAAGAMGWTAATASANTIGGWARNAEALSYHQNRARHPNFMDALHDSHWEEIDAEATALRFVHEYDQHTDASTWEGVTPQKPGSLRDRIDWGLWNPLIIGLPAAGVTGAVVHSTRTSARFVGDVAIRRTGFAQAITNAANYAPRNIGQSLGIGASLTLLPLLVGGMSGPVYRSLGIDDDLARFAGAGTAAVASGVVLSLLLGGKGSGLLKTTPKVLAGMAVAAGVGLLASSAAVNAQDPPERRYDTSRGVQATPEPAPAPRRRALPR